MLRSLFSAVSGLQAHQEMMDVIGNDIANVNTTGYKSNNTIFQDLLSQTLSGATAPGNPAAGVNPSQIGLGVRVIGTSSDFTQGTSEQTGRNLDLSIQGDGMFIGESNGQTLYTRAGSLQVDANGNLSTPDGMLIQGWQANAAGVVNSSGPLTNIQLFAGAPIAATPTTSISVDGNIGDVVPAGSNAPSTTLATAYDHLGAVHSLKLVFDPGSTLAANGKPVVTVSAYLDGSATPADTITGVTFDTSGASANPSTLSLANSAAALGTTGLTLDLTAVTAAAIPANSGPTIQATAQNGAPTGVLQTFDFSSDGTINGVYSNGTHQALGRIALASFSNPAGLERAGDTAFRATSDSGLPQVGAAGTGGRGQLSPGTLEMSNVDLAKEFTKLIEAQRGFEANGKVITSSDQLLQTLINLKQ